MSHTERGRILDIAKELTEGDRDAQYGDPMDNLGKTAALWSAYLDGRSLQAHDVAVMFTLAKVARSQHGDYHEDDYVDAAAYMAIAGGVPKPLGDAPRMTGWLWLNAPGWLAAVGCLFVISNDAADLSETQDRDRLKESFERNAAVMARLRERGAFRRADQ